jgi:hypothetical protein
MTRPRAAAAVAAALCSLILSAAAVAQPAGPPSESGLQRTGLPPMDVPPINGGTTPRETHAVFRITSVEIMRSSHAPYLDIVRARGIVSSTGWEEAELVPLTRGIPADGMLQLILVGRPPERAADATGYESVEAIFPLETNHPFKGVNVHGAVNAVTLSSLPGYAESPSVDDDCGRCVGKTIVPKGRSPSSARPDVLREEQLPPQTRVVRPADGILASDSDPNRLTLILDKDNRVVTAVWE